MKRAGLAVVAALSLAAACTEAGRSVVLVDVTAGTGLGSVQRVLVHVTQGGASLNHIETTDSLPLKLGVYLPKSVSGMADVEACAFNDINELVGGTDQPIPITVVPGATIGPEFAVLRPGASPQVCRGSTSGRGGAGGAGGGSGAGGSGGAGGGASGSGGSAGGAGAGGSGGSIGGAGGRGGTGGTTGAGGTGGTGGRGGAGGSAAGSGGAGGGGGRGGGAGTGAGGVAGTGTGGAAGWRGAVAVANSTATERLPSVAVDFNGNAVVVFEHDGDIWFNRYSASGNSWSGASMIITGGTYAQPSVAVDGTARFTVVWTAAIGAPTTGVWYATSTDTGNTWVVGTQALATTNTYPPVLSVNSNGLAVVAWSERIGGTNNSQQAVARIRDATGGWLPAQVMHTGDDANNRYPAAAMSDVGDAFVVWEQVYNGVNSVWVRRYTSGAWTPETQLETFDAGPSYAPAIATNVHGVAIVTYLQLPTPTSTNPVKLLSQRYAGGGFVAPVEIRSAPLIASTNPPSVHLDDNGLATIVWASAGAQGLYSVEAARMTATDTAPSQVLTEATPNYAGTDNTGGTQAPMPVVRGDGKGNVVFVWRKRGLATASRFDLYARQYTTSAGWLGEALIETLDGANNVFNPAVAVNGSNEIVATWYYGGTGAALDVYANIWR